MANTPKTQGGPKKVSATSTKNEILKAYNDLLEELKEEDPGVKEEVRKKEILVKEALDQDQEKIIKEMASLKVFMGQSLDSLEEKLGEAYKRLKKTNEAIEVQEERLKELYNINAEADSLAALIAAQKKQKAEFEDEMRFQKEQWQKEKTDLLAARKEEEDTLKKQRKREEEEYSYTLQQKRKMEQDQYLDKKTRQEKELAEQKAVFDREIHKRELAVKESEDELAALRKDVAAFPEKLEKETEKAVAENTKMLKAEFDHSFVLHKKETENDIKLKEQSIQNLQQRIKELEAQLKQAFSKVDSAESSVKEITIKAIESSAAARNMESRKNEGNERTV